MDFPLLAPIRQTAPQPVVADIAGEVRRQWLGSRLAGVSTVTTTVFTMQAVALVSRQGQRNFHDL